MADSSAKKSERKKHSSVADSSAKKSKRKKLNIYDDNPRPLRAARRNRRNKEREQEEEEGEVFAEERENEENTEEEEREIGAEDESCRQWRNLELVLSIQNKEIHDLEKVGIIFNFVKSRATKENHNAQEGFQTVNINRLVIYVSNWIQSLLISSAKKFQPKEKDLDSSNSSLCLDYRCWQILKFCLEESLKVSVSLSLSRDLLKVIYCVARNSIYLLNVALPDMKDSIFTNMESKFYSNVCDCIKLIFSSHGGLSNTNLDLWTSVIDSVLELLIKIYENNLGGTDTWDLIKRVACSVLEPFSKFLKLHPCRKSGFRDFVDKLLEPLLQLLGLLHDQIGHCSCTWLQKLFKLIEEVASYGLFHPVHLDEYMGLHSIGKYMSSLDGKLEDSKTEVRSYLRHLFDKLENLVSKKKGTALSGIGELFCLFVDQLKRHKRDSSEPTNNASDRKNGAAPLKDNSSSTLTLEKRKSIFDFFVQSMEPLILDIKMNMPSKFHQGLSLLDVYYALKSINKTLSSLMQEKVHVRTEDTSEGACLNFFKVVYGTLMSCCSNVCRLGLSSLVTRELVHSEMLTLMAKELVIAVGNLMEIEYEVIGDDVVNIWLMILTFLAISRSLIVMPDAFSFTSATIDLGCHLVNLYAELRQVSHAIFALCRGLRHLSQNQSAGEMSDFKFSLSATSLPCETFAKSAPMLLRSPKFRRAVCNAIKTIPEGQTSNFVKTLASDISDSLEWVKVDGSASSEHELGDLECCKLRMEAELLGMALSEIYTAVLGSLSVTSGNSYLVGVSIKELLMALYPSMSSLLAPEQDDLEGFVNSVVGVACKNVVKYSVHWILLFFFRLYTSIRSLYRQAISLMPPNSSKKMSALIGDFLTAHCGRDWIERTNFTDEGYFSWIIRPSESLLSVIKSIIHNFFNESSADYACLIYIMHVMAIQRLVDLNRQIRSAEYLVQRNGDLIRSMLMGGADLVHLRKIRRKWKRLLSSFTKEASGLTGFIMEKLPPISTISDKNGTSQSILHGEDFDSWDAGICGVNEKTLSTAVWWLMCRNIDVWFVHATEKKLKKFLSLLILSSCTSGSYNSGEVSHPDDRVTINMRQISLELLGDTVFYEQRFVPRYMASRFCQVLKTSIYPLFRDSTHINTMHFAACHNLLNLISHVPQRLLSFKSFSRYATHVFNLERLIISNFTDSPDTLCLHQELLKLLVSCRRAIKHLVVAFYEDKLETNESSVFPLFSERSIHIQWLLNSTITVASQRTLSDDKDGTVNAMIFSLMDHTSYIFLTLSKHYSHLEIDVLMDSKKLKGKSSEDINACKNVNFMAETLIDASSSTKLNNGLELVDMNKISSLVSCIQGFLWGLVSNFENTSARGGPKLKKVRWKHESFCRLRHSIGIFVELLDSVLQMYFVDNEGKINSGSFLPKCSNYDKDSDCKGQVPKSDSALENDSFQWSESKHANISMILSDYDLFSQNNLRKDLLRSFFDSKNLEAAFLLRELFMASSALMRLRLRINYFPISPNLICVFSGISHFLIMEFSRQNQTTDPNPFSFLWLDGALKFLEELGCGFLLTASTPINAYNKLLDLHLRAIGKCILLQGKNAMLASHDNVMEGSGLSAHYAMFGLEELKARLRMSFEVLVKSSSEFHLSFALKALERALVGVKEGEAMVCEVTRESVDGGAVSCTVAAGVDCLDMILEYVTGKNHVSVVKQHIPSLVSCLLNIMTHLEGPGIFYAKPIMFLKNPNPNQGSVILMCVKVLTRIAGKHALFQMDSYHIGQSLRVPAVLFKYFHDPRLLKGYSNCSRLSDTKSDEHGEHGESSFPIDREFLINLYGASCRLLSTVVKHHKSECLRCMALLQNSVQTLLSCLEMVDMDSVNRKRYFSWDVREGIKCASYLRRVYEEIRQQKDVFGQHCFLFLSDYVWLYSGYGKLKKGINREVDEALKLGIYALIDVCSTDNLKSHFQYLHTVFGEGPCRSTLSNLQHDYEQNFQYKGKV